MYRYNRDFIQRMIEEAGRVLAEALARVRAGQAAAVRQELPDAYDLYLELDADALRALTDEAVAARIGPAPSHDEILRWTLAADLLDVDGQACAAVGETALAADNFRAALRILRYLQAGVLTTYSFGGRAKFAAIARRLSQIEARNSDR